MISCNIILNWPRSKFPLWYFYANVAIQTTITLPHAFRTELVGRTLNITNANIYVRCHHDAILNKSLLDSFNFFMTLNYLSMIERGTHSNKQMFDCKTRNVSGGGENHQYQSYILVCMHHVQRSVVNLTHQHIPYTRRPDWLDQTKVKVFKLNHFKYHHTKQYHKNNNTHLHT